LGWGAVEQITPWLFISNHRKRRELHKPVACIIKIF
jgi:hypothetical protein